MSRLFQEIDKAQEEARRTDETKPRRFHFPLVIKGKWLKGSEEKSVPSDVAQTDTAAAETVAPTETNVSMEAPVSSDNGMDKSGEPFVEIPVVHSLGKELREERKKKIKYILNRWILNRWGGVAFLTCGVILGIVVAMQQNSKKEALPSAEQTAGGANKVTKPISSKPDKPVVTPPVKTVVVPRQVAPSNMTVAKPANQPHPGQPPVGAGQPAVQTPSPSPLPESKPAAAQPLPASRPNPVPAPVSSPSTAAPASPPATPPPAVVTASPAVKPPPPMTAQPPQPVSSPPQSATASSRPATPSPVIGQAPAKPKDPPVAENSSKAVSSGGGIDNEVKKFLQSWAASWEKAAGPSGNIEEYMNHYSDLFAVGKTGKDAWRKDKVSKAKAKEWIKIEFDNVALKELTPGKIVEVRFDQVYKSPGLQDKSKKTMVLGKEPAGWRIVSEKRQDK